MIVQQSCRPNSELFSRLEALSGKKFSPALTTNTAGKKRAAQPETSGPKRKTARPYDESNRRQGASLSSIYMYAFKLIHKQ